VFRLLCHRVMLIEISPAFVRKRAVCGVHGAALRPAALRVASPR
jgi:hypothetical protein